MSSDLLAPVVAGTRVAEITADSAYVRAMLACEAALARAQGRAGLIPSAAASVISRVALELELDAAALAVGSRQSATPVIPLLAGLRDAVQAAGGEPGLVHLGSTTQDIVDSAAMLVARDAVLDVLASLGRTMQVLADLSVRHRDTVMAARTLGQIAIPTTFGLKVAGWLLGLIRARDRLTALHFPAQLGGPVGTLSAMLDHTSSASGTASGIGTGPENPTPADARRRVLGVVGLYAEELGLDTPITPWHTERSVVTDLGAALATTARALGKPATDVILMAQTEVGEVAESSVGGSSAMPHKRNPALSVLIRSAALQVPAFAQVLYGVGEHERAAGAWQAEWLPLRECLRLTGGAAETAAELVAGLRIFPDKMRANADLTPGGTTGVASDLIDRILGEL